MFTLDEFLVRFLETYVPPPLVELAEANLIIYLPFVIRGKSVYLQDMHQSAWDLLGVFIHSNSPYMEGKHMDIIQHYFI